MTDLGRFSQLLAATEHFCGWRQQKVAKIVQCGEHLSIIIEEVTHEGGLKFLRDVNFTN
jgi:hypothetical protein